MPPKIRGMTSNSTPSNASRTNLRRFTLMLSGEDALDDLETRDSPKQGLPHERFLLGEKVPLAPVLLLGQSNLAVNPKETVGDVKERIQTQEGIFIKLQQLPLSGQIFGDHHSLSAIAPL